jgi:hypothetical protein
MLRSAFSFAKQISGLPDGLFLNQKYPSWVNFGGPWNEKCLNIL